MGVVYEAEQKNPRRLVALKVVRGGHVVDELHSRMFRRETESLGRLRHPNIAAIYESGHTDEGHDFFAMELVQGQPLGEWIASRSADRPTGDEIALRLRLFQTICDAVHYAHQRGVIHRDLKPSNVVVSETDPEAPGSSPPVLVPNVKILDFGLAKIIDEKAPVTSIASEVGMIMGSLPYMAPEQALGEVHTVDVRTDVYALGVILFELLSGQRPYDISGLGLIEAVHVICQGRPRSLRDVWTGSRGHGIDLQTIVGKALEKDPDRRYASAAALAEDVQRFLTNQPLAARPPSSSYRAHKFIQRHRLGVNIAAFFVLLVSGFSVWMSIMYARSERLREAADLSNREAELDRERARRDQYYAEMALAGQGMTFGGSVSRTHELLSYWLPSGSDPDLRGWEWFYLDSLCHLDLRTLPTGADKAMSVAWNPTGSAIAVATDAGGVLLWDGLAGEVNTVLDGQSEVTAVTWSRDGKRLAAASADGAVTVWSTESRHVETTLRGHRGEVRAASFDPAGTRLATASIDGSTRIWDIRSGIELQRLPSTTEAHSASVAWSPDGARLAAVDVTRKTTIWDPVSGAWLLTVREECQPTALAWSPDGRSLAASCYEQRTEIWDGATGRQQRELRGHTDLVHGLAWSWDGTRLATAGWDHTTRVWRVSTGEELATLRGHVGRVNSVDWSPDDRRLVSAGGDGLVKIWDADGPRDSTLCGVHDAGLVAVAWDPRGSRLASADTEGTVIVWEAATRRQLLRLDGAGRALAWAPDGARFALATASSTVTVRRSSDGELLATVPGLDAVSVAWSPDGRTLAAGGRDGRIELCDATDGRCGPALTGHTEQVNAVSWNPDGRRLASASADDSIRVWDATTGREQRSMSHEENAETVAWSADGTLLASGSNDRTVRIWNPTSGDLLAILRGHSNGVGSVSWSPDGTRLASACVDMTVKVWDPVSGRETLTLGPYSDWVTAVAWSPDGLRLASGGRDHTVRIYDATEAYTMAAPHL